jgi:hypothetical protein
MKKIIILCTVLFCNQAISSVTYPGIGDFFKTIHSAEQVLFFKDGERVLAILASVNYTMSDAYFLASKKNLKPVAGEVKDLKPLLSAFKETPFYTEGLGKGSSCSYLGGKLALYSAAGEDCSSALHQLEEVLKRSEDSHYNCEEVVSIDVDENGEVVYRNADGLSCEDELTDAKKQLLNEARDLLNSGMTGEQKARKRKELPPLPGFLQI